MYCSSALLLRELRPVSLLLSSFASYLSLLSSRGNLRTVCLLGGNGGLREEEEEDLESVSGSGDIKEWISDEIPDEVEPVELDLKHIL